jgi:hypothetical protein
MKKIVKKISDYSTLQAESAFACHWTGQKMPFSALPTSAPSSNEGFLLKMPHSSGGIHRKWMERFC